MIMRTVVTDAFQFILIRSGWGGDLSHWISFVVVVFNRGFLFILGLSRLWVI